MKRLLLLPLLLIPFLTQISCSTLDLNAQARKNLAKCKFEFERVELKKVNISGLKVRSLDLDVFLKITNKAASDVALDHLEGEIYLDDFKASKISHKRFVRIKPGKTVIEPVEVHVPFADALKGLGHKPEYIIVKAKVYVNIMIGSYTFPTPFDVSVEQKFKVPYDEIEKQLKKAAAEAGQRGADYLRRFRSPF